MGREVHLVRQQPPVLCPALPWFASLLKSQSRPLSSCRDCGPHPQGVPPADVAAHAQLCRRQGAGAGWQHSSFIHRLWGRQLHAVPSPPAGEPSCASEPFQATWHSFLMGIQKHIRSLQPEDQTVKASPACRLC